MCKKIKFFIGPLLFLFLVGCSDVHLNVPEQVTTYASKSEFCLKPPEKSIRYNKVIFVVDKSGSNDNPQNGNRGNDPDDIRRADNIQAFFDENKDNPYYKWGHCCPA